MSKDCLGQIRHGGVRLCCALGIGLLLLPGCRQPAAQVSGCGPNPCLTKRNNVLTEQLVCDSAGETVHHPIRATRTVLQNEASWLAEAARGLFGKRLAMRLHGPPGPLNDGPACLDPALIEHDLQAVSLQLYRDGAEALAVLNHLIDAAVCRIDVLMYTWDDDPVGWDVAQHLAARAGPGRRVRVLVDGGANLLFAPSPETGGSSSCSGQSGSSKSKGTAAQANRVVCWLAGQPCVEVVRTRNPFAHFDHRKLVLIDGRIAWAGGRNFTYPSFFERHDLSYTLEGPLTAQLQECFERDWRDQGGAPAEPLPVEEVVCAQAGGRLVHNTPLEHSLRHALYHAVDHARHHVWLENPYLCDNGIITKLAQARRRGADVRVVMTIETDTSSINHANRVTANRLLAAGVRVYLYPGRVHTKAALVDGCWGYVGSGNFDLLSLRRNHELGVVLGPGPIVRELDEVLFQPDFCPDWELHAPLHLSIKDCCYEMVASLFE